MEIGNGTLLHSGCLEAMAGFADGSIDLVVTSPPYDNLRTYNDMPPFTFATFQPIASELARVLKPGGVIVWNVNDATINGSETGSSFRQALYFKDECGLNLHDTMIWEKSGSGALGSTLCYAQNFEYMFVLSKGRPNAINLIEDRPNVVPAGRVAVNAALKDGVSTKTRIVERKATGKRTNIWKINPQQRTDHPAPFPIDIARDHIVSWSNPGDLVFDPFMGSGTTAIAAERSGRRWTGIERDEGYYNQALARIYAETTS